MHELTRHHLIPKSRHKNKRNKKVFDRQDVHSRIALLCRPCHKNIHAAIDIKELEREYNTLEALAAHPDIAKFTGWIKNKPHGVVMHSKSPLLYLPCPRAPFVYVAIKTANKASRGDAMVRPLHARRRVGS